MAKSIETLKNYAKAIRSAISGDQMTIRRIGQLCLDIIDKIKEGGTGEKPENLATKDELNAVISKAEAAATTAGAAKTAADNASTAAETANATAGAAKSVADNAKATIDALYAVIEGKEGGTIAEGLTKQVVENTFEISNIEKKIGIIKFQENTFIRNSGEIGQKGNLKTSANSSFVSSVIQVQAGDEIIITGRTASVNAPVVCILDNNENILYRSEKTVYNEPTSFIAPENSLYFIINFIVSVQFSAYYADGIVGSLDKYSKEAEDLIKINEKTLPIIEKVPGLIYSVFGYESYQTYNGGINEGSSYYFDSSAFTSKFINVNEGDRISIKANKVTLCRYALINKLSINDGKISVDTKGVAKNIKAKEEESIIIEEGVQYLYILNSYSGIDYSPEKLIINDIDYRYNINKRIDDKIQAATEKGELVQYYDEVAVEKGGFMPLVQSGLVAGVKELYITDRTLQIPFIDKSCKIVVYRNYKDEHKNLFEIRTNDEESIIKWEHPFNTSEEALGYEENIIELSKDGSVVGYAYIDWEYFENQFVGDNNVFQFDIYNVENSKEIAKHLNLTPKPNARKFSYRGNVKDANELIVYINGKKAFNDHDYKVDTHNRVIITNEPIEEGGIVGFHYSAKYKEVELEMNLDEYALGNYWYKDVINFMRYENQNNEIPLRIVSDPTGTGEKCIKYMADTESEYRGRSQLIVNDFPTKYASQFEVDIYFPKDTFDAIKGYAMTGKDVTWYTITEWFTESKTYEDGSFEFSRVSFGINCQKDTEELYYVLTTETNGDRHREEGKGNIFCRTYDKRVYGKPIPYNEWFTLGFETECANNGHFLIYAIVKGKKYIIIDDIIPSASHWHYLDTTKSPFAYTLEQPIKQYFSPDLKNYAIKQGKPMTVYYKNLKYKARMPI